MTTWILGVCSVYLLIALLVFALQGQMVYQPGSRSLSGTPRLVGLEFSEFVLDVEPGVKVHGWLIPPPESPPSGASQGERLSPGLWVLFCHGNAGNISHRLETIRIVHGLGMGMCIFDYRGYGQSTGQPDVPGTFRDAQAAWEMLSRTVPPQKIVVWGRSLGGAVAANLAAEQSRKAEPPAALILESTFTSIVAMGRKRYPFLPIRFFCRYPYDTEALIGDLRCPVLLLHSPEDEIVPHAMGRKLYDKAPEPKEFIELTGDHNRGFLDSGESYPLGIRRFLEKYAS